MNQLENSSKRISKGFMISLLAWPIFAFSCFFLFDAPGSTDSIGSLTFAWTIWSYPLVILISIVISRLLSNAQKEKPAFVFSLLPFINVLIIACVILYAIVMGSLELAQHKKEIISGPKCPDGKFLYVDDGMIYIAEISNQGIGAGSIGHISNGRFDFSAGLLDKDCTSREKCIAYMNQCKDKNNKTIFDNFNLTEL